MRATYALRSIAAGVATMFCLLAVPLPAWASPGPPPSLAEKAGTLSTVSLTVLNKGVFVVKFCLKTTTTMLRPRGSDRSCSDWIAVNDSQMLTADVSGPLDDVYLDTEVDEFTGTKTSDDKWITGAKNCRIDGVTISFKISCDTPPAAAVVITPPSVAPFAINVSDPNDPAMSLLSLLAWLVTAAAVAGLIITGMNMALQLRRGDPGEFSEHWRGFVYVALACLVGATAGPIVAFLAIS